VGEGMSVNVVTSDMARWVAEDVSEDGISGFESLEWFSDVVEQRMERGLEVGLSYYVVLVRLYEDAGG
jgi:hypothetical protein